MATSNGDVISIDPTAPYVGGDFIITGHASSPSGVKDVTLQALSNARPVSLGTVDVDQNGNFTFDVPITGKAYSSIFVTETDNAGLAKEVNTGLFLDGNWSGEPYVASENQFTSIGVPAQTLYFRADGSVEGEVLYGATGSIALRRVNNPDGTNTTTVTARDITVQAASFDTIQNSSEPGNTFVFDPGEGLDVVRQFVGNGPDHDALSLKGSDFGYSLAEVLANTHQYKGAGTYIVDPVTHDAVRLTNVPKAELAVNGNDITFHA